MNMPKAAEFDVESEEGENQSNTTLFSCCVCYLN